MTGNLQKNAFPQLLSAVKAIAEGVAGKNAADVDSQGRFPIESVKALKEASVLSALIPKELGGAGCSMREAAELCSTLAQGCGSSGMVLAMHFSQLACITRHALGSAWFVSYLRQSAEHQYLLASITSEVGTFGDTRSSICAVERSNGRFVLNKQATTGSYCGHADAILVTCRRAPDAPNNDQVLVLVREGDYKLTQTTTWDTMGMRGTCSPGFNLESAGDEQQIVPAALPIHRRKAWCPTLIFFGPRSGGVLQLTPLRVPPRRFAPKRGRSLEPFHRPPPAWPPSGRSCRR